MRRKHLPCQPDQVVEIPKVQEPKEEVVAQAEEVKKPKIEKVEVAKPKSKAPAQNEQMSLF